MPRCFGVLESESAFAGPAFVSSVKVAHPSSKARVDARKPKVFFGPRGVLDVLVLSRVEDCAVVFWSSETARLVSVRTKSAGFLLKGVAFLSEIFYALESAFFIDSRLCEFVFLWDGWEEPARYGFDSISGR